jgi:hypothetical protein
VSAVENNRLKGCADWSNTSVQRDYNLYEVSLFPTSGAVVPFGAVMLCRKISSDTQIIFRVIIIFIGVLSFWKNRFILHRCNKMCSYSISNTIVANGTTVSAVGNRKRNFISSVLYLNVIVVPNGTIVSSVGNRKRNFICSPIHPHNMTAPKGTTVSAV